MDQACWKRRRQEKTNKMLQIPICSGRARGQVERSTCTAICLGLGDMWLVICCSSVHEDHSQRIAGTSKHMIESTIGPSAHSTVNSEKHHTIWSMVKQVVLFLHADAYQHIKNTP